ncbi:DUF7351 domain-containing protein [Halovenus halobia]|uniref:DUF7351 domain-containing protein n=1 Tax=Halovenus halobia TaxID=3396622 RepID=UPI003F575A44
MSEESLDPADAFSLLGEDVRLNIIAALDEATGEPIGFSELQDRVGVEDSGQFNYHLSQLVGHFVTKPDDGYRLTAAGERLARAVSAGLYTDSPELPPFGVDGICNNCGLETLDAAYADEQFIIACRECDHQMLEVDAPPSLIRGRDPEEALAAFEEWSFEQVEQAYAGICPTCGGPVNHGITEDTADGLPFDVLPEIICDVCHRRVRTSFAAIARRDPAVNDFHERHFVDYRNKHYWEVDDFVSDDGLELLSESPFRMQVTFTASGEICEAVVDDTLNVVRVEIRHTADEDAYTVDGESEQ